MLDSAIHLFVYGVCAVDVMRIDFTRRPLESSSKSTRARFASNNIEINRCNSALREIHDSIGHKLYLQCAFDCAAVSCLVLIHSDDAQETSNQLIVTHIIYIAFQFNVKTIDVRRRQTLLRAYRIRPLNSNDALNSFTAPPRILMMTNCISKCTTMINDQYHDDDDD